MMRDWIWFARGGAASLFLGVYMMNDSLSRGDYWRLPEIFVGGFLLGVSVRCTVAAAAIRAAQEIEKALKRKIDEFDR